MGKPACVAIGSRWVSKDGRVWIVLERLPFGRLEIQQEGRAYFGTTRQRDFLLSFTPA